MSQKTGVLNTILRSVRILDIKDQRKIFGVCCAQILLATLDLLGILLFASLIGLTISGPDSSILNFTRVLQVFGLDSLEESTQMFILGSLSIAILLGRTIISILLTKKILLFFSRRGAAITANLICKLLSQPLHLIQSRSRQETIFSLTSGINLLVIQVLATFVVLIADFAVIVLMCATLLFVDPVTAVAVFMVFLIVGVVLHQIMSVQAKDLGRKHSYFNVRSYEKISEVLETFRELVVKNRQGFYVKEIRELRSTQAEVTAKLNFLPYVSKYAFETSILLGGMVFGALYVFVDSSVNALEVTTLFVAAASRIAPAALRLQQGLVSILSAEGQGLMALEITEELAELPVPELRIDELRTTHGGFHPEVSIENLNFTHKGSERLSLSDINLKIPKGSVVAIVGPSGAGKTTLVDLLLGILQKDSGNISISGQKPRDAIQYWPGAIAYVPQDVTIVPGTLRENVALGYPKSNEHEDLIFSCLELANLNSFLVDSQRSLDALLGDNGAKLSGGERQRVGIARALFTRPGLIVLDEATSSLDGETEEAISNAIQGLKGSTTVVIIAHRLSSIMNSDLVVYMEDGEIKAKGSFNEVRAEVPRFDQQAKSMGL
jgi:ABC-type multidrug transport system fused ATPase/permease subunit